MKTVESRATPILYRNFRTKKEEEKRIGCENFDTSKRQRHRSVKAVQWSEN